MNDNTDFLIPFGRTYHLRDLGGNMAMLMAYLQTISKTVIFVYGGYLQFNSGVNYFISETVCDIFFCFSREW